MLLMGGGVVETVVVDLAAVSTANVDSDMCK